MKQYTYVGVYLEIHKKQIEIEKYIIQCQKHPELVNFRDEDEYCNVCGTKTEKKLYSELEYPHYYAIEDKANEEDLVEIHDSSSRKETILISNRSEKCGEEYHEKGDYVSVITTDQIKKMYRNFEIVHQASMNHLTKVCESTELKFGVATYWD